MPNLSILYKKIYDKHFIKEAIKTSNATLLDLIGVPCDLNEIFHEVYRETKCDKKWGIRYDMATEELFENLKVHSITEGIKNGYLYIFAEDIDEPVQIKANDVYEKEYLRYQTFLDFNSLTLSSWDRVVDYEKLDKFFNSATFLVAPKKEQYDPPSKFLWDDFDAARSRIERALARNEEIYIYTVIEDSGGSYIEPTYRFVDRIGYFLADKNISMDFPLRYG